SIEYGNGSKRAELRRIKCFHDLFFQNGTSYDEHPLSPPFGWLPEAGVHANRVIGSHSNHSDPGLFAVAGFIERQGKGQKSQMHLQPAPVRNLMDFICER